jgi:hypothetical protein
MKVFTPAAIGLLAILATACGGLSETEQRAAAAHADNMCQISQMPAGSPFGAEFANTLANAGDVAAWADGKDGKVMAEANRIARQRGCIN